MARDPDCLFCKIVAGEIPATRVREDERTIAFMDINPATRGHALVIPREHATDLHAIGPEDLAACATANPVPGALATRPGCFSSRSNLSWSTTAPITSITDGSPARRSSRSGFGSAIP